LLNTLVKCHGKMSFLVRSAEMPAVDMIIARYGKFVKLFCGYHRKMITIQKTRNFILTFARECDTISVA
jgi:hypothetical protein